MTRAETVATIKRVLPSVFETAIDQQDGLRGLCDEIGIKPSEHWYDTLPLLIGTTVESDAIAFALLISKSTGYAAGLQEVLRMLDPKSERRAVPTKRIQTIQAKRA
jgi:hypothetical protein